MSKNNFPVANGILVAIVGIILTILFLELVLRMFPSKEIEASFYQVRDPYLIRKFKIVDITIHNSDGKSYQFKTIPLIFKDIGFRDDGIDDSDVYAIALGDSFTMAPGVKLEETWTELLEDKLNEDVVNMGVSGYSAIPQTRMLEKYGNQLKPKVVLFSFYYNDYKEDNVFTRRLQEEKFIGLRSFLESNSALYNTMRLIVTKLTTQTDPGSKSLTFTVDKFNITLYPDAILGYNDETGRKLTENTILEAKRLSDGINAEFIIVIFPTKEHVYFDEIKKVAPNYNESDFGLPRMQMLNFCNDNNLTCIDLYPHFVTVAQNDERIFFDKDIHLTELGNRLVSEIIFNKLYVNP